MWNLLTFLPQPGCMKSWYHDKIYDFQTSFVFYRILKWFDHMFVVMVCEHDVRNSLLFHEYGLTLDSIMWKIIFWFIIFQYSKHLQFKFELSAKNPFHETKWLNIDKRPRNIPKLNMEYYVKYVDTRKIWEGCIKIFLKPLPCV